LFREPSTPTRAPLRSNAWPAGTRPNTVRVMLSGPRVVSPPIRRMSHAAAMMSSPRANASNQPGSAVGRDKARVKPMGVAPMAARSLVETASARWPSRQGSQGSGKCTPATRVSVDITSCSPAGTASKAQSSPMPNTTSPPALAQAAAAK